MGNQPIGQNPGLLLFTGEHGQAEGLPQKPGGPSYKMPAIDFTDSKRKSQRGHIPSAHSTRPIKYSILHNRIQDLPHILCTVFLYYDKKGVGLFSTRE